VPQNKILGNSLCLPNKNENCEMDIVIFSE